VAVGRGFRVGVEVLISVGSTTIAGVLVFKSVWPAIRVEKAVLSTVGDGAANDNQLAKGNNLNGGILTAEI
jgi:hypothetical protein